MGGYNGNSSGNVIEWSSNSNSNSNTSNNLTMNGTSADLIQQFSQLGLRVESPSNFKDNHALNHNHNLNLIQVMDAVEAAENIIKKQMEEYNRLKEELERKTWELEHYKLDASGPPKRPKDTSMDVHSQGPYKVHLPVSPVGSGQGSSSMDPRGTLVVHHNAVQKQEDLTSPASMENHQYSEVSKANGSLKVPPSGLAGVVFNGFSQFSAPSSDSFSPSRHQREEFDSKLNLSSHDLMQISEINKLPSHWKHDLMLKVREHEEEILQLRNHLAYYSLKESRIRDENHALEKLISQMRMAFDQQQQEWSEATSKSVSQRQDIIDENIRLSYALQVAQQEKSTFVSSLLPLLQENNLQPHVLDAQSIVGNLKILFKHLQEQLSLIEAKLSGSQYHLVPLRSEDQNNFGLAPTSSYSFDATMNTSMPMITSHADFQTIEADWLPQPRYPSDSSGVATKGLDHEYFGRSYPAAERNSYVQDTQMEVTVAQHSLQVHHGEENSKPQAFSELVTGNEVDDAEAVKFHNGREASVPWGSVNSSYMTPAHDDPNLFSSHLPPVQEEPSSSVSEAAEDDPLPAIKDLQIIGEAYPGRAIQACGYSINGTTSCNFEWVRYMEDGSVHYISGAKQPIYLITADDVDSYLAIEVQPLDDTKRKGELVKVFANDHRKIACDTLMKEQIEKTLHAGHKSFQVLLAVESLDKWEPAILAIKREGYSIKCNGPLGVVVTEKFSLNTSVEIPYGFPSEFIIHDSNDSEHFLQNTDSSSQRDTIVLLMRLFILRAGEKRKGRRKGLFFK